MEWVELIGLFVMLLAFLLPTLARAFRKRREQQGLSKEEIAARQEQERREYEQFLLSLGAYEEVEALRKRSAEPEPEPMRVETPPPAAWTPPPLEPKEEPEPPVQEDAYAIHVYGGASRIRDLLGQPNAGKTMVLLHEVFSPPKSMRDE